MATYNESDILERLGIFGFYFLGDDFTWNGHTLHLFESYDTYEYSSTRWSLNYVGSATNYYSCLRTFYMSFLSQSAYFGSSDYVMSAVKKIRDSSGLNVFLPESNIMNAFLTANSDVSLTDDGWMGQNTDHYDDEEDEDYYTFYHCSGRNISDDGDYDVSKHILLVVDMNDPFIPRYGKLKLGGVRMSHSASGSTKILDIV